MQQPTILKGRFSSLPARPRILLCRLTSIGDCVMASAASRILRQACPEAFIAWVVQDRCRGVVEGNPDLDTVIVYRQTAARWLAYVETITALRRLRFDIAIDLHGILKASALARLSEAATTVTLSTSRKSSRWLADVVVDPGLTADPERHTVDRYRLLLQAIGVPDVTPQLIMPVSDADHAWADELLQVEGSGGDAPRIALVVGTSKPHKDWPWESFTTLAERLANQYRTKPILIGGPAERDIASRITAAAAVPCLDLVGRTTLPQLGALLSRCGAVVTGDTGSMHIAAAMGKRVVAIMHHDHNWHNRPYGDGHILLTPDANEHGTGQQTGLGSVSVDAVAAAVDAVLSSGDTPVPENTPTRES